MTRDLDWEEVPLEGENGKVFMFGWTLNWIYLNKTRSYDNNKNWEDYWKTTLQN